MEYQPNPCKPDCIWRHGGCHSLCPRYKRFRAYKDYLIEERNKANIVNCDIAQIHIAGTKRRHRKRENEARLSVWPREV